jgi:hypothetical protein
VPEIDTSKLRAFWRRRQVPSQTTPQEPVADPVLKMSADFVIGLADETWRLGQRASRLARLTGDETARGVVDCAERLQRLLADFAIAFEDHTGEQYDSDERLDVAQVEGEVSETSNLWITQTVKPTVIVNGRIVRRGQVIVSAQEPISDGGVTR